ncbi:MAG: AAA family ATPase [Myxococcaceae bacterium]|nr:AAA family ATPase [Myxococcaceae bacterium]
MPPEPFLRSVKLLRDQIPDAAKYPFDIPALKSLDELELHPNVTFFIGENGSGKSTLIEALAVSMGFNAEGGGKNQFFSTRRSESELHKHLRVVKSALRRPRTGFFLRAESFYNLASDLERDPQTLEAYGGRSFHDQSHGEGFIALVNHRFGANGLYILDEPEAALSPQRQLALLKSIDVLVRDGESQLIIATHSPIVLAYPQARIYALSASGIETVRYEETEHFALTRDFLNDRERYLRRLFTD